MPCCGMHCKGDLTCQSQALHCHCLSTWAQRSPPVGLPPKTLCPGHSLQPCNPGEVCQHIPGHIQQLLAVCEKDLGAGTETVTTVMHADKDSSCSQRGPPSTEVPLGQIVQIDTQAPPLTQPQVNQQATEHALQLM